MKSTRVNTATSTRPAITGRVLVAVFTRVLFTGAADVVQLEIFTLDHLFAVGTLYLCVLTSTEALLGVVTIYVQVFIQLRELTRPLATFLFVFAVDLSLIQ